MEQVAPSGHAHKKQAYKIVIDKDKCKSCLLCIAYCPSKHLEYSKTLNKRGVVHAKTKDGSICNGCKICTLMCPDFCIDVVKI